MQRESAIPNRGKSDLIDEELTKVKYPYFRDLFKSSFFKSKTNAARGLGIQGGKERNPHSVGPLIGGGEHFLQERDGHFFVVFAGWVPPR